MEKLLTLDDIEAIIGYPIHMMLYDDLEGVDRIEDVFSAETGNVCLLLVRNGPNVGHWVVLTKDKGGITFFDSYGGFIDEQLDHTPIVYEPDLSRLLSQYSGKVNYNPFQLQRYDSKVSTCGRWCAYYVKNRDVGVDNFVDAFKEYGKGHDLDRLIVTLTSN